MAGRRRDIGKLVGLFVLLAMGGCAPLGADIGGSGALPEGMIPDPSYQPRIGDHAVLFDESGDRPPLLKDVTAYDIYVRSRQERDTARLQELETQGWLRWAEPGSRVAVLGTRDRNHVGGESAAEVRLVNEGAKGPVYWTPARRITRLVPRPAEVP